MMHLSTGEIRAYLDNELSNTDKERIKSHLANCEGCRGDAEVVSNRMMHISEKFSASAPQGMDLAPQGSQALSLFEKRSKAKEKLTMYDRLFNRKYRYAWVAVGVIAILAVAMLFPQVRAIGSSFLGLFRVEQFTILQVDPDEIENRLGSSSNFEYLLAEDVVVEEYGEAVEAAGAAEASDLAGFSVRLPTVVEGNEQLKVQPGAKVSMVVDLPKVQAILDEVGGSELQLPALLDGAEVSMELPVAVVAAFGDCEVSPDMMREARVDPDGPLPDLNKCITLTQFPSPEISAPPGLDIASIGEVFLQLLGMTPEEAAQFSQNVDWTTTLVIPIPRYGTEYQDVLVDGVEGTLIMQSERSDFPHYLLVWIKDGIVYGLTGPGLADSALEIANSLE
jgi:hypothetical protein